MPTIKDFAQALSVQGRQRNETDRQDFHSYVYPAAALVDGYEGRKQAVNKSATWETDDLGIHARLVFMMNEEFLSDLRLEFKVKQDSVKTATLHQIKFNVSNVDEAILCESYDSIKSDKVAVHTCGIMLDSTFKKDEQDYLKLVTIPFNGNAQAVNLFTAKEQNFGPYDAAFRAIQALLSESGNIEIFVSGGECVQYAIRMLNKNFALQRECNPLKQFYSEDSPQDLRLTEFNDWAPPGNRPQILAPREISFASWPEYVTYSFQAQLQEYEYAQLTEVTNHVVDARIVARTRNGNYEYFAFLDFSKDKQVPKPSDTCTITFDHKSESAASSDEWKTDIVDHCGFAPRGMVTAFIYRPWDDEVGDYRTEGYNNVKAIGNIEDWSSSDKASAAITAAKPIKCRIRWDNPDVDLPRAFEALKKLDNGKDALAREILLGNDLRAIEATDVFNCLPGEPEERNVAVKQWFAAQKIPFDPDHQQALQMSRCIPRLLSVHGGPGTGKSTWFINLIQPLLHCKNAEGKQNQVLVLSILNTNVDFLATAIDEVTNKWLPEGEELPIIRMHSRRTEELVFLQSARHPGQCEQAKAVPVTDKAELVGKPAALKLMRKYEEQLQKKMDNPDSRYKVDRLSLARWMAKGLGLHGNAEAFFDPPGFSDLLRLGPKVANGKVLEKEDRAAYERNLGSLREEAKSRAAVIVSTISNAADSAVYHGRFNPCLIVVDEAGLTTESALWICLAHYPGVPIILVGDRMQIGPFHKTDQASNSFYKQLGLTSLARYYLLGGASATLNHQHRFPSIFVRLISPLFYDGAIMASEEIDTRPELVKMREHIDTLVNKKSEFVFVNLDQGECEKENNKSSYNEIEAAKALDLVEKAIASGVHPSKIGVVLPYGAQQRIVKRGLNLLHSLYPETDYCSVKADTIDSYQSQERDLIILSLVVTENPGFLDDSRRLNVGLTRCRYGLIILGNGNKILNRREFQGSILYKVVAYCQREKSYVSDKEFRVPNKFKGIMP